jgi:hypothetical protein
MWPVMNDPRNTPGASAPQQCESGAAEDPADPRPEPTGSPEDGSPEEAGYGYGV